MFLYTKVFSILVGKDFQVPHPVDRAIALPTNIGPDFRGMTDKHFCLFVSVLTLWTNKLECLFQENYFRQVYYGTMLKRLTRG